MPFPDWFKQSHAARSDSTSITSTIADDLDLELFPGDLEFTDADADNNLQLDPEQQNTPKTFNTSSQPTTPEDSDYNLSVQVNSSTMPTTSSPIDIATPTRNASSSPSSQGKKNSNFLDPDSQTSQRIMTTGTAFGDTDMSRSRQDSSFAAAKPISMHNPNRNNADRPRRESLAGSLVGGMSWGGVSVGSWIRDDIIMAGTSPFPYQSPSYHSSSYLPKLEANFMRDFSCCGNTLPTLHDLLQHYEESHAQQTPQSLRSTSQIVRARENSTPNNRAAMSSQPVTTVPQQVQQQQTQPSQLPRPSGLQMPQAGASVGGIQLMRQQQRSHPATPVQKNGQGAGDEMDGVEDMEMDDAIGPMDTAADAPIQPQNHHQPVQAAQQSMFGQRPRPTLNLNSNMQHSGLRTSQPTTPATSGFGFQNNPTVSSVNTPTLTAQPMQQSQTFSPDTSAPGTPSEMDSDFTSMPMNMNMGNRNMNMNSMKFPFNYGGNDLGLDLCIDEPAKRLYSPNGGFNNQRALQQQFAQFGLGQGQFANNADLMRAYQQQQLMASMNGMGDPTGMMMGEEHKPFRCPVIGCEKAYKNQNGLKYHKTHGHQTQQLHENGDGTFSIVNPETSIPYSGTEGMEREKPYKCDFCGKRYKNLNGLKYHKQHSPPCDPDLKLNNHLAAAGLAGLGVIPGLPGIGEEGLL
ncbi:C2H2 transcription factor protein [Rutstroemia sp. NJR-2017a WRK4]|nr:C2H2 transcription factor protein [Rutstroemia sp. NJR-2017a WRK4]